MPSAFEFHPSAFVAPACRPDDTSEPPQQRSMTYVQGGFTYIIQKLRDFEQPTVSDLVGVIGSLAILEPLYVHASD